MRESPYKDLSQWGMPVYQHETIQDAVNNGFALDGIYQISLEDRCVLDVLVQNIGEISGSRSVLIGLNGAVTQRETKKGPFFSGTSITKEIGVPSISISDPTLDIDGKVGLAWYAGNETVPDLPARIAAIINGFAEKHEVRPILFGGSGAGFAALSISSYLNVFHTAVVWNPQTRIVKYFARFVERYVKSAFPKLWSKMYTRSALPRNNPEPFLASLLDRSGISHSLDAKHANQLGQVLFLQNRDDWHVGTHAEPFLQQFGIWRRKGPDSFMAANANFGAVFGDWGEGHAAPPRELIHKLLDFCVANTNIFPDGPSSIFSLFAKDSPYDWPLCTDKPSPNVRTISGEVTTVERNRAGETLLQLDVVYSNSTSTVLAELSFHPSILDGVGSTYAFYLLVDGKRVQARWYESKPYVAFEVGRDISLDAKLEVVAFSKTTSGLVKRIRKLVSLN